MSVRKNSPIVWCTNVVLLWMATSAHAQTAGMLSFQGLIKDSDGDPVNGPVTLQFRIYDAQTGGNLVDMDGDGVVEDVVGQDVKEVTATPANGIVSAKFGPVSPKAFDGSPRWLEVTTDGTALSRNEMAGTPAIAEQINKPGSGLSAINVDSAGNIGIGSDGAVPSRLTVASPGNTLSDYTAEFRSSGSVSGAGGVLFSQNAAYAFKIYTAGTGSTAGLLAFDVIERATGNRIHKHTLVLSNGIVQVQRLQLRDPAGSDGNIQIDFTGDYSLWRDDDGAGSDDTRLWLVGPPGGEFIFGPRGGSSFLDQVRVKSRFTRFEGAIQITGGSDLAEPFTVIESDQNTIEPGMVVSIDPENPGKLVLATEPYDRKVAGIISGAKGLQPGMIMKSEEHEETDGDHPVALTGRVWCWCDASYGSIGPGDRLTTSPTPGHAMKVTDEGRAPGAVIGKAMTCLVQGKALVLVLIQPQ
jgi:hypothetical protein